MDVTAVRQKPEGMFGTIFASHACEIIVASTSDVAQAKKHIDHCPFKRHEFLIEGTVRVVHQLCHEVRRMLLDLVIKYIPKDNSTSGKETSDLAVDYRPKKYVFLEADEIFRANRLLQLLLLSIRQFEQKGVSFTPKPRPSSISTTGSLPRCQSTPSITSNIKIHPLTFGGHYCQYTPYKDYDVELIVEGKHRVLIMENMDEHPYDLVCKRLEATGRAKSQCLIIASRTITQKIPTREYQERKSTEEIDQEQGEEERNARIEKMTKLIDWSHWVRVECRLVIPLPVMGLKRSPAFFQEDGDVDD